MTVETTTSKAGPYAGAGTVGPFPVPFRFLDASHLQVTRTDASGMNTVLELGTDYSVQGVGQNTGAVTLLAPLAAGFKLTVLRNVPATQEADYVQNDAFPAESHERALDKLTMLVQQQGEMVSRALVVPPTDAAVSMELPSAAARARRYLSFDADGRPVSTTFDVDAVAQASQAAQDAAVNAKNSEIAAAGSAEDAEDSADFARQQSDFVAQQVAATTPAVVRFSGDGLATTFGLPSVPGAEENTLVYISGVYQQKNTYQVPAGTSSLIFSEAPPVGTQNIEVVIAPSVMLQIGDAQDISFKDSDGVKRSVADYLLHLNGDGGAAMISGRSSRPYAAKQTIQDLMDGIIQPDGFVGTSTQRMQRAIEFSESIGGATVSVRPGQMSIGPVYSLSPGVFIRGASRNGTKILAATNEDCFNFNFIGGNGWGVKDLSIIYSGPQSAGVAINASAVGSATVNGEIENVYVERPFKAVQLRNSQGTSIEKFASWYFEDSAISSDDELNDIFMSRIFLNGAIYGTSIQGPISVGLRFTGKAHALMASHIEVIQCAAPMRLEGGAPGSILVPAFSTFHDCFFDSSLSAVYLKNTRNIKFSKSWFSQRSVGCILDAALDTTFEGSSFVNNAKNGCSVAGGSRHTKFIGCIFDSNGQEFSGSRNGLVIDDGIWDWSVIGGTFGNLGAFPATQDVGIGVGVGTERYEISGVNFSGNTFAPVYFSDAAGANSGDNKVIQRNVGMRTKNLGSANIPAGQTSVEIPHGLFVPPRADQIQLTAVSDLGTNPVYLDTTNITSTTFTVRCATSAITPRFFTWRAQVFND